MIYRAAAAYPYVNADRATAALRGQLRLTAQAGGGIPDWTTMVVEGPTETPGLHGGTWFEWTASVAVIGGRDLTRDAVDDDLPALRPAGPAIAMTMPHPPIVN